MLFRTESRRNAALSSVRNSPGALAFGDARTSDDHSCDEWALLIDELSGLSNDHVKALTPDKCAARTVHPAQVFASIARSPSA